MLVQNLKKELAVLAQKKMDIVKDDAREKKEAALEEARKKLLDL